MRSKRSWGRIGELAKGTVREVLDRGRVREITVDGACVGTRRERPGSKAVVVGGESVWNRVRERWLGFGGLAKDETNGGDSGSGAGSHEL